MMQLEISKLMDEYQDGEFFPEGGSNVDTQAVKDRVLAQAAPAKEKRIPRFAQVLLAAALAVGCVLMIAAGIPGTAYRVLTGTIALERDEGGHKSVIFERDSDDILNDLEDPIRLEDGRIILIMDAQRTDITDLIDEETPYIYDDSDPSADTYHYLIAGGTPDRYGWLEWFEAPQPLEWRQDEKVIAAGLQDHTWAAHVIKMIDVLEKHRSTGSGSGVGHCGLYGPDYKSEWLRIALDRLGILMEEPDPHAVAERRRPGIYFFS